MTMEIDYKSYRLTNKNFIEVESIKKQIVLAGTLNSNMKHFIGWKHRSNGLYKKTAHFTIDKKGNIYKHFDPSFQSRFFSNNTLNSKSIIILLDNEGWLIKNSTKNTHNTWLGHIYKESDRIVAKTWRGYNRWSPYTEEQFKSALELVKSLCKEFYIPLEVISHNTKVNDLEGYSGVLYKSNLEKFYTDLNPSWDFENFKNKLEVK